MNVDEQVEEQASLMRSAREERSDAARDGNVDFFLDTAASYNIETPALVAIAILLREIRDELRGFSSMTSELANRESS